ncbi:unnamed protein product [Linum trigynum]
MTTADSPKELIHEFSESPEKLLHQLTLHDTNVLIKARLLHSWRSVSPKIPEYIFDFGTLWADETGMLIHGIGNRNFVTEFERKLSVGSVYKIQKFIVQEAKQFYRPCRNNLCIFITPSTSFEDVTASSFDFTSNSFEFCDFASLEERSGSRTLLTDVVGWLTSISQVDHISTCNGEATCQKLVIQNERGISLSISLWGKLAYNLRATELITAAETSPVIIAIGGLTISTFRGEVGASSTSATRIILNPQTLEFGYFKPYPNDFGDLIKVASNASDGISSIPVANETPEKNAQRALELQRTVSDLINIRAIGESANKVYICKATVTAVKSPKNWAYRGFTKCYRTVTDCGANYWCEKDNRIPASQTKQWYLTRLIVQDATDEAIFLLIGETADKLLRRKCSEVYDSFPQGTGILPPDIETLYGQTLEFHVKIPNKNYKGGEGDFTITNIIGLYQRSAKTAHTKLLTLEPPKRALDLSTTGEMESPLHTENKVTEEGSNSGKTDVGEQSTRKGGRKTTQTELGEDANSMLDEESSDDEKTLSELRPNARGLCTNNLSEDINMAGCTNIIDRPLARVKKEKITSASSSKRKASAVEIVADKKSRKNFQSSTKVNKGNNSTITDFDIEQDSRRNDDCSNKQQKRKQVKSAPRKATNNRHTHVDADKVIMVNSDDEKSFSDNEQPLLKLLGNKKAAKKDSVDTKVRPKDTKYSINSPLARVKKEKLEVASKSTSTTTNGNTSYAAAEVLGKRKRQPLKKYGA